MNTKMIASPDTHSEYTPTSLVPASSIFFIFVVYGGYGGYGGSRDVVDFLHSGAISGRCPLRWSALRWKKNCPAAPCRGTVRHVWASWLYLGACRRLSDTGFGLARPPTCSSIHKSKLHLTMDQQTKIKQVGVFPFGSRADPVGTAIVFFFTITVVPSN